MSAFPRRAISRAAGLLHAPLQQQQHAIFLSSSTAAGRGLRHASGGPLPGGTQGEASSPDQACPIGPYYETILIRPQPVPEVKPEEPPTSSEKSPARKRRTTTTTKKEEEKQPPAAEEKPAAAEEKKQKEKPPTATKEQEKPPAATEEKQPTGSDDKAKKAASSSSFSSSSSSSLEEGKTDSTATSAEPATAQEKAAIIFGSRLAGPMSRRDRLEALRNQSGSRMVAGVLVPPRPSEPDNCCMSGCVNCVWDRYRDDLEEYAAASAEAEVALQKEKMAAAAASSSSMDEDGGGSETNWAANVEEAEALKKKVETPKIVKDLWDDDLYKHIPVEIREFMKHEKRLKQKHERDGTMGG